MHAPLGFRRWSSPVAPSTRWLRVLAAVGLTVSFVNLASPAHADPAPGGPAQAAKLAKLIADQGLRASQLAERYDEARLQLDDATDKLTAAKAGVSGSETQVEEAQAEVHSIAVNSYTHGGVMAQIGTVVPKTPAELTVRQTYLRSAAQSAKRSIGVFTKAHEDFVAQEKVFLAAQQASSKALAETEYLRNAAAAADASEQALVTQPQGSLATLVAAAMAQQQADIAVRFSQRSSRSQSGNQTVAISGMAPSINTPTPSGSGASAAIAAALAQMGKPYVFGGSGPGSFDCSGLTAWAWGHAGHPLPHSSSAQYYQTAHVSISQLQPGDLVFYGSPPHHVGLYVGNGQMINALHSGTVVRYDSIYLEGDLIGGGRAS